MRFRGKPAISAPLEAMAADFVTRLDAINGGLRGTAATIHLVTSDEDTEAGKA